MSHGTQKMGGRAYTAAKAELRSRGDAYCWRGCGTWLLVDAPNGHPQQMTLGHVIAREDGGALYDPANIEPECAPCNYSDGARRTNAKLGNPHRLRQVNATESKINPRWYEPYQEGKAMVFEAGYCAAPGCDKLSKSKGYCTTHYSRQHRGLPVVRPAKPCKVCQTPSMNKFCTPACAREGAARMVRDLYRTRHGLPVNENEPTKARTPRLV